MRLIQQTRFEWPIGTANVVPMQGNTHVSSFYLLNYITAPFGSRKDLPPGSLLHQSQMGTGLVKDGVTK